MIDQISVLKPIQFESIRRNEVGSKLSDRNIATAMKKGSIEGLYYCVDEDRQQRAATILRDVAYIIEAHFILLNPADKNESEGKHLDIFFRRARRGQYFHAPYLGTREFPAYFKLIEENEPDMVVSGPLCGEHDLGYMLHDIAFTDNKTPLFFRAKMINGIIAVPAITSEKVKS